MACKKTTASSPNGAAVSEIGTGLTREGGDGAVWLISVRFDATVLNHKPMEIDTEFKIYVHTFSCHSPDRSAGRPFLRVF
jgi:hypothetical protein